MRWIRKLFSKAVPMKKVKVKQMLMTIPVEGSSDDYDIEIEESLYRMMQAATKALEQVSDACNDAVTSQLERFTATEDTGPVTIALCSICEAPITSQGWTCMHSVEVRLEALRTRAVDVPGVFTANARPHHAQAWVDAQPSPASASQQDPVINTAVTDREMSSSTPDMSLEEFRERPEKTRAPPRPRANSWRHKE